MLSEPTEDGSEEPQRPARVAPTATGRPIKRPKQTPTTTSPEVDGRTAGTPTYDSPQGTPSTRRIHNPTQFR